MADAKTEEKKLPFERRLTTLGGATILVAAASSVTASAVGLTEPAQMALTTGVIGAPVYLVALRSIATQASLKSRFALHALGAVALAGALGGLTGMIENNKQNAESALNALPEIAPETLAVQKPQTLAEKNCAHTLSGRAVKVEHNGQYYRLVCP